jgi:hypothetical protein
MYELGLILLVLFNVVELKTLAVGVQVIRLRVKAVPVALAATVGTLPGVGQLLAPVNWFK